MLKIESLETSTAKIVYSKDNQSILSLSSDDVLEMFSFYMAAEHFKMSDVKFILT